MNKLLIALLLAAMSAAACTKKEEPKKTGKPVGRGVIVDPREAKKYLKRADQAAASMQQTSLEHAKDLEQSP
ncbi:MAG: hypothetical protein ABIJ96_05795 [Elusimicrobiota bacterium]